MPASGEPRAAAQRARAVAQVADQRLESRAGRGDRDSASLVGSMPPSADQRPAPRLVGRHAGAQVVVDVELEVALELGGEVAFGPRPANTPPPDAHQRTQRLIAVPEASVFVLVPGSAS